MTPKLKLCRNETKSHSIIQRSEKSCRPKQTENFGTTATFHCILLSKEKEPVNTEYLASLIPIALAAGNFKEVDVEAEMARKGYELKRKSLEFQIKLTYCDETWQK